MRIVWGAGLMGGEAPDNVPQRKEPRGNTGVYDSVEVGGSRPRNHLG